MPTGFITCGSTLAVALTVIAAGASAMAQTPPAAPTEPQTEAWPITEEIVVTARHPGPATWRIKKGDAEVWVIGVLPYDLKDQAWDTRRLVRILTGASALYIHRSGMSINLSNPLDLFKVPGWLGRMHLPKGEALQDVVGPDLYLRYQTLYRETGVTEKLDETEKPLFLGLKFRGLVVERLGLQPNQSAHLIEDLAKRAHLPVKQMDSYSLNPSIEALLNIPDADQRACFANLLDQAAFDQTHTRQASQAWAVGDLKTVRANLLSSSYNCFEHLGALSQALKNRNDEIAHAIDAALEKPGKTVFVLPLQPLLRRQGVLEKIRAEGVEISSPDL